MRSLRVSAMPMPSATKTTAGRGAKPKRRPWKSSFTGLPMLAARRTLRRFRHSAAGLPVVTAATLSERRPEHEIPGRDGETTRKGKVASPEVLDEHRERAAGSAVHVR